MGNTDAFVSGSIALQYIERVQLSGSDLEVFVQGGTKLMLWQNI